MSVLNLTSENFDSVIKENEIAIVDFWAPWCGPCRMMGPVIDEIAEERSDIAVCKVNVDEEQALAEALGIRSIPTLYFIPMKGQPQRAMGAMPKEQLKKMLDSIIK